MHANPNSAINKGPKPVTVTIGLTLVIKPSLRNTNMPDIYYPVNIIKNSDNATLSNAFSKNTGLVKLVGGFQLRFGF